EAHGRDRPGADRRSRPPRRDDGDPGLPERPFRDRSDRSDRPAQPRGDAAPKPARYADRRAAFDTLAAVFDRGEPMDQALDRAFSRLRHPQDRAFARALATYAIRRRGSLLHVADQMLQKPLPPAARASGHALILGLAQLFLMDVPDHAAADSAVWLADEKYKNLINALVRRAARERDTLAPLMDTPGVDLPRWLKARWEASYGGATTAAIAQALRAEPPLDLTVPKPVPGLHGERLPTGSLRLTRAGDIRDLPGFKAGGFWVQDAAAALPARLVQAQPGERVADLCAAPGGKTLQLAATGAAVTAVDKVADRLRRVQENLDRCGLQADLVTADLNDWSPEAPFDALLLDAPCSATGTLRRRPDVAWHKSPKEIEQLARIQSRLLSRCVGWLKPGGRLIYAVCSLEPEEGEAQIDRLLSQRTDIALDPVTAEEACDPAFVTERGFLRTLPSHWAERGGLDGFFATRLIKTR
ncbi:MAG: RsmB/NOP family class I SAM-dependent RNA methyltransferase, partial [Rhodothalassiaceae bacterium]